MTNKQLIVLASSVIAIAAMAIGVRWRVAPGEPDQPVTTKTSEPSSDARLFPPARSTVTGTSGTPLNPTAPAQAGSGLDEAEEEFNPYARCEAMDNPGAWTSCTDETDAMIEALEDACDQYEDDQWSDCIEAAARLQSYSIESVN